MTTPNRHPALRPQGFHPLLNGQARMDRTLVTSLLDLWDAQGFSQVSPIQVDAADILLNDQPETVAARTFRFLDPHTGAMLALLSDVTLGIARLAKGELADAPRPLRLSYEGQAIRVVGSSTRPTRQYGQVGLEVMGSSQEDQGALVALALTSLQHIGLANLSLSLVLPTFAADMIHNFNLPDELAEALDRKDEGKVLDLAGDQAEAFLKVLAGDFSDQPSLQPLENLATRLRTQFTDINISVDAFEQRGFGYQTGLSFALYADGIPGELGRGGAYMCGGEPCFGFTFYRDTLITAVSNSV